MNKERIVQVKDAAVGLISGGLDSAVIATYMMTSYGQQHFLFCDYGQKTLQREREAFHALCNTLQPTSARELNMTWLQQVACTSALFDPTEKLTRENRKNEYVPFRNASLLAAAVALAETVQADDVLIGSTGGDTTCPDNSPAFIAAYQHVIDTGTMIEKSISITAPLTDMDKQQVIQYGLELHTPFELTWSCHNNLGSLACGACSNCESRIAAFTSLGEKDPIAYEQ
jgi:7-cyano-7-deazaguanine synthase